MSSNATIFSRSCKLFGKEAIAQLSTSRVAVFGLGGVGSYVAEALARGGIGQLDLIDNDTINLTNINRQLYALHSTVGYYKTDVAEKRIKDINPDCKVTTYRLFFLPETAKQIPFNCFNYVADCIDTVSGKIEIIKQSKLFNIPIISSMGTGNKLNPLQLTVTDISKTTVCPLARVMRHELKKRNISNVKVLYSTEQPIKQKNTNDKQIPGSTSFVPSAAGLIIASEIIKEIIADYL